MKLVVVFIAVLFILTAPSLKSTQSNGGWSVITSNQQELILTFKPKLLSFDTIFSSSGELLLIPKIELSQFTKSIAGSPLAINSISNFTVPSPSGFKVESINIGAIKSFKGLIAPQPQFHSFPDSINYFDYNIDTKSYSEYVSPDWVQVNFEGIARDRYIASINAIAARWNASTQSIEIPDSIYIKIKFNTNGLINSPASNNSPDDFRSTLNHDETKSWLIPNQKIQSKPALRKSESILSVNNSCILIKITSEGVYKIDNSMLSNLGVNITKDDINTISIHGNGGAQLSETVPSDARDQVAEQPIIVNTKPDGSLDNIIFYAYGANGFAYTNSGIRHWINHYCDTNFYILTWGAGQGLRQTPLENPPGTVENNPTVYYQNVYYQEEMNSPYSDGSGRIWFGRTLNIDFPCTFTQQLYDLVRNDSIIYRSSVAQRSGSYGTFTLSEYDGSLMSIKLSGESEGGATENEGIVKVSSNRIAQDNRSVLRYSYYNPAGSSSTGFFNWYEISYPRVFAPINNTYELNFFSDINTSGLTEYSIPGFTNGGTIFGYDVTDLTNPKLLSNLASSKSSFNFRTELNAKPPKRFFISSQLKIPEIKKVNYSNLRGSTDGADLVVITNRNFISSAQNFADYRSKASNIKVKVVTTDDIFVEFSSGLPDPTAIRNYLTFIYHNWNPRPKWVLLWGHGHYDYKNISSKALNFVPPYESDDSYGFHPLSSYTTDDYFVRCGGNDDIIDMAIGRIPVNSNDQGNWMVEKIKHYETASSIDSWRTTISLIADDSWTTSPSEINGNTFTVGSEVLSANIPVDFEQKKIYLPEYPTAYLPGGRRKPGVTQEMLSTINTSGNLIMSWIGHGNPRVWAHEEILDRDITIPQMKNIDKLFFTTAATCDFAHYDATDIRCGAEVMLLSQVGGSIGIFAADRSVNSGDNSNIDNSFYNNLFKRDSTGKYPTLGDIMMLVKQTFHNDNDERFNLLGDPSMRLLIPKMVISIDTINGINITDADTVHLKGLSKVNISARIINPVTKIIDTTFNGLATITMLDCDDPIQIRDEEESNVVYYINKFGSPLNCSSYTVSNGRFNASFLIPKDISYSIGLGRLFAFAFDSAKNNYAKGATRSFDIKGLDTTAVYETDGPDVNIFLDSRNFTEGDFVSNTPLLIIDLMDKSGINTTGRGIGHKIEVWLDNSPNSIDLTNKYTNSLKDPLSGTVQQMLFGLAPGLHSIKVRAWDVFNNFTVNKTSFKIADSNSSIVIEDMFNYPNPFTEGTAFRIKHNATPPVEAELKIYNEYGDLITTIDSTLNTLHISEINWNGFCLSGQSIPQGVYVYKLYLQSYSGQTGSSTGMILHIK